MEVNRQLNFEFNKQQYLNSFVTLVKGSANKNQFLKNVQDFDQKFTYSFQSPNYQNQQSVQSFSNLPQQTQYQKPKNPFINNNIEDNKKRNYSPNRSNNFISGQPNYVQKPINNQNKMNISGSRTQNDFYKPHQGAKTFNHGFLQKPYEKPNHTQDYSSYQVPIPQNGWQTNEAYQRPNYGYQPGSNLTRQNSLYDNTNKQYGREMINKFANMQVNDNQRYYNPNQLSINSHQNFISGGSDLEIHPNEFLAGLQHDEEPNFVKYYKKLTPVPPQKPDNQNQMPFSFQDRRVNPFTNQ